ncbi:hypothetical protein AB0B10_16435 [Micromonospora arborensis]|uniref:hypothetical protein n=1 Tax=Micromonospora arborensis TaxID=2116518 RepID=UPI0033EA3B54
MRLRHCLPAVALGAVALGAALGAEPARANPPSPTSPQPADAATSPKIVRALLSDVVRRH